MEKLQDVAACLKPVESRGAQLHLAEFLTTWTSELSSEERTLRQHSGAVQLDNELSFREDRRPAGLGTARSW